MVIFHSYVKLPEGTFFFVGFIGVELVFIAGFVGFLLMGFHFF